MRSPLDEHYEEIRLTFRKVRARTGQAEAPNLVATDAVPLPGILSGPPFADLLDIDAADELDPLLWIAAFEELSASSLGPRLVSSVASAHLLLALVRTQGQVPKVCDRILAGQEIAALAVQEPGFDWAKATFRTRVDGHAEERTVRGLKTGVTGLADADHLVLVAGGEHGPGVYVTPASGSGIERASGDDADPALTTAAVTLTDGPAVAVFEGERIPPLLSKALDFNRLAVAATCVGGAQHLLDLCVEYAGARTQFSAPISSYQAVSHRCADMAVLVDQMRGLLYEAAMQAGAPDPTDFARATSTASLFCTDGYSRAALDAIRVHGGIGITWESPTATHYRRAVWTAAQLGGREFERQRLRRLVRP